MSRRVAENVGGRVVLTARDIDVLRALGHVGHDLRDHVVVARLDEIGGNDGAGADAGGAAPDAGAGDDDCDDCDGGNERGL